MPVFALISPRAALAAGLVLAAASGAPAEERVGVNSAVNPQATGTPPGGAMRSLVIGQDVVFNEHINTAAKGQTQLLFLDESAMTVGPNSSITIDQFVFDPKSGTGKLAMSATRGILRYVGGKLSKQNEAVTLRTGTATLAVRGGAFIANLLPDGTTEAVFLYGRELRIIGLAGGLQILTQPGFEVTIKPGAGPSSPTAVPPRKLAGFTAQFAGTGNGGAPTPPTDANVAGSGISADISGNFTPPPPPPPGSPTVFYAGSTDCPTGCASNPQNTAQGASSVQSSTAGAASAPPPPPPPPVTISYAGRMKSTNGAGTARGFVDQSAAGDSAYSSGTLSFPQGAPQQGVFTASVGALGTVSFPLVPGRASFQGSSSNFGSIIGTSFLNADNTFFYASISPTSAPGERLFISGGTPVNASAQQPTGSTRTFAFSIQPDAALQSTIPFIRPQAGGNLPSAAVSPFYVVAPPTTPIGDTSTNAAARVLQASLAVSGQGANQQSAIAVTAGTIGSANGTPVVGGGLRGSALLSANGTPVSVGAPVGSTVDGAGNSLYGGSAITGFVLNQTAPAAETTLSGSGTTYGFTQPAVPQAVPGGVGANRTTGALTGNFGGLMYTNAQPSPYIVTGGAAVATDAATNRVQANLVGAAQSPASGGIDTLSMQYGGLTGNASSAFVDNNTFAALENPSVSPASKGYFVSSGAAGTPTSLLPSGASYCQCQYLQWGYWGGDLAATASTSPGVSRIDRGHINTWVAGVATPLSDIATLARQNATGTYTGAATGSVYNNGASYLAAGGFTGTYNFGTQTGTFAINNFDGHSFAASGSAPLSGASYSAGVTTPGVKGAINGTFYGPQAAETGGSFAVQSTVGPTYLASGVFAGKR